MQILPLQRLLCRRDNCWAGGAGPGGQTGCSNIRPQQIRAPVVRRNKSVDVVADSFRPNFLRRGFQICESDFTDDPLSPSGTGAVNVNNTDFLEAGTS